MWQHIRIWLYEGNLFIMTAGAVFSAFVLLRLPLWLHDRFGEVSIEQLVFFIRNPLNGTDPAVKASFIETMLKEPLIIAVLAVLPAVLTFILLNILHMYRTDEEVANQIPAHKPLKGAALALLVPVICCEIAYPFVNRGIEPTVFYNQRPSENVLADPRFLIAHAGGAINGAVYTNSRESIDKAVKNGFTMIELDLDKTSDGEIAALHDWDYFRGITGNEKNGKAMPPQKFLEQKIYGKYTPMDVFTINDFFERNSGAVLVTDKIRDFKGIIKNFKFTKRLIVEVFSYADYEKALKAGILYPALSLNALGTVDAATVLKKNIRMVTVSDVFLEQYREEILCLHRRGVTVMLYAPTKVINDPEYLKSVLGKTVSMAYVDFCAPKNPECHR